MILKVAAGIVIATAVAITLFFVKIIRDGIKNPDQ